MVAQPFSSRTRSSISGSSDCTPTRQLPTAVQLYITSLLPPNDLALSGRLAFREASEVFSEERHRTAFLSQTLPPHAAPWAEAAGHEHVRQLPFMHKLQLLSTAATSGSEVNLGVALALVQPSVLPELLSHGYTPELKTGEAAVRAGHLQAIGWLMHHCPGLLHTENALAAAAQQWNLAGLQAVWEVLQGGNSKGCFEYSPMLDQEVLDAAAASATPDAVAKLEWVMQGEMYECEVCRLKESTSEAAVCAGQLGTLRWLRARGCPMDGTQLLRCALRHADLAVAQWLVDEAVSRLPEAEGEEDRWEALYWALGHSSDWAAKLRWLQGRGAPPLDQARYLCSVASAAADAGQVGAMRYLLSAFGPVAIEQADSFIKETAAASGSIPMMECMRQGGMVFSDEIFGRAAACGKLDMFRWLVHEAGASPAGLSCRGMVQVITSWPCDAPGDTRNLRAAVQLLVEAGFRNWHVGEEDEDEDADPGNSDCIVLTCAASRGDLALVQYLLHQQQPQQQEWRPDWGLFRKVAGGGCEAMLEWLVRQPGCLESPGGYSPYLLPLVHYDLSTLMALRRLDVPWGAPDLLVQAVQLSCITVPRLRWLAEQGAPVGSRKDMDAAVAKRAKYDLTADEEAWLKCLAAN